MAPPPASSSATTGKRPAAPRPAEPVFVTLTADLSLRVGDRAVTLADLPMELDIVTRMKRDTRLYISADRSVPYGEMMLVMSRMRGAGYLKIGLVGIDEAGTEAPTPPAVSAP